MTETPTVRDVIREARTAVYKARSIVMDHGSPLQMQALTEAVGWLEYAERDGLDTSVAYFQQQRQGGS